MTASRTDDARRADGQPEPSPQLVAVHVLPGQARLLRVTTLRPLPVVACEALPAADRALAREGAKLAVMPPAAELQLVTS